MIALVLFSLGRSHRVEAADEACLNRYGKLVVPDPRAPSADIIKKRPFYDAAQVPGRDRISDDLLEIFDAMASEAPEFDGLKRMGKA